MISVEELTKCYGSFKAVDNLSFTIDEGHVYGFLGPNGAGKSTTMNIMTGCLSATEGHIRIDGHDIFEEPHKAKRLIGYLPEQPPLYMNESPLEYLHFVGKAKGLRGSELEEQVNKVIVQTRLEHMKNRRIQTLSKGYRQRVGIAQSLLGNPKVIILDEPTVGLDPLQIIEIRDLVKELGKSHTVIFSSHILSEVQAICDKVLIINGGKLIAFDTPDNLEKKLLASGEIELTTNATPKAVMSLLSEIAGIGDIQIEKVDHHYTKVHIKATGQDMYQCSGEIFRSFADGKYILYEMSLKKINLEDIFLELTDENAFKTDNSLEQADALTASKQTTFQGNEVNKK